MNSNGWVRFRRVVLLMVSGCLLVPGALVRAQEYPARAVNLVVPQSAGGQADILARVLAEQMSKLLNQPVTVLNRDGAAGTIGVTAVKEAAADGYTIGFGTQGPFTIQPQLRKALRYAVDDFEFLCQTNTSVLVVVVGPNSSYLSLKELLDAARKAPGTITMGSIGVGSGPHLVGEAIAQKAEVKFNHIPFRSIPDLNAQLIGGGIDVMVTTPTLLETYKTVRPLAVAAAQRLPSHPDVPLLSQLGFVRGTVPGFMGVYGPKGLQTGVSTRLRQACDAAAHAPNFVATSDRLGSPAQYADNTAYSQKITQDLSAMTELMRALAIKPE